MARPQLDEEEEKPLDPAVERVRRKLVRFVAINLGLLFLALMAVVLAIVYKARTDAAPPSGQEAAERPGPADPLADGVIPLPPGARLVSQSLSGSRLALDVELAGGERAILIYDVAAGRLVGRFAVSPQ